MEKLKDLNAERERQQNGLADFEARRERRRAGNVDVVIYHAGCWDGFCAAWLASKAWPDARFVPALHSQGPPEDLAGQKVLIVDFSYKREVLRELCHEAAWVVVLDHHKTAEQELAGLDGEVSNLTVRFDMSRSGGRLMWEHLIGLDLVLPGNLPGWTFTNPPWLVRYTEDRDLWRWELPNSRTISAALRTYPLDFEVWDELHDEAGVLDRLHQEGEVIRRYEETVIESHVRKAVEIELAGYKVLAVNATTLLSDIAGELAKDRPFGVCYFERADGMRQWSLRSREGGVDVSQIARQFGGGGHPQAAGFEDRATGPTASQLHNAAK